MKIHRCMHEITCPSSGYSTSLLRIGGSSLQPESVAEPPSYKNSICHVWPGDDGFSLFGAGEIDGFFPSPRACRAATPGSSSNDAIGPARAPMQQFSACVEREKPEGVEAKLARIGRHCGKPRASVSSTRYFCPLRIERASSPQRQSARRSACPGLEDRCRCRRYRAAVPPSKGRLPAGCHRTRHASPGRNSAS